MALREEIIKITVDTKQGIVSINGVTTELKKAKAAFTEATAAIGQNTAATGQNTASTDQNSASKQANATATKRTEAELQKLIATAMKSRATTATNTAEYNKQSVEINKLQKEMAELSSRGKAITAANNAISSSAGLAGAATMELGRVFSDINYGIRGIANNVSQFASLFVTLSVSAGGAGKALSELFKQFRGPLGILVLVQIAIAAIEALDKRFDFFGTKVDESTKSLEEFNKKLSGKLGTVELLKAFAVILQDSTADVEDQEYALQQLKKSGYDPAIGSIEDFIEAQIKLATVSALSDQFKEEVTKIQALKKDLDKEVEEANAKVAELLKKDPKDVVKRIVVPTGPGTEPATLDITAEMALESAREEVRKTSLKREEDYFSSIENLQKEYIKNISGFIDDNPFLDSLTSGGKGADDDVLLPGTLAYFEDLLSKTKQLQSEQSSNNEKYQEFEDIIKGINYQIEQIEGIELPAMLDEDLEKDLSDAVDNLFKGKDKELEIPVTIDLNEALFDDRLKFLKKFELKAKDLTLTEQNKRLDEENEQSLDSLDEYYADKLGLEGEERQRVAEFIADDIVLQKTYQEELTSIEEFYANKRIAIAKTEEEKKAEDRVKSIQSFKNVLGSVEEMFDSFAESRRAREEMELAIIESSTQKQLANENLTEGQRNEIRLNAEKQKEQIQKRSIIAEMKYQQAMFAIKAAELAANISMDVAEGVIAIKKGAAKTASAGFPNNIPLLLAYAAQAVSIMAGINTAKKQAKTALAKVGSSASLGPDASAGSAPQFNVVGASQLSNLSETIATSEQSNEPIRAYVVLDDLDTANTDKNTPKSDSSF